MASAKAGPRKTSRTVTLKLTEGEADMLIAVLAQVGGHPTRSPRKYVRRVYNALTTALGYGVDSTDGFHLSLGQIEFFDYDDHPEIDRGMRTLAVLTSAGFQLHADRDPIMHMAMHDLADLVGLGDVIDSAEADAMGAGLSGLRV